MKNLIDFINEMLNIDENRVVTFDGKAYPNNGWCVVMAGGSGTGKGYTLNSKILLDAKVFDVDELKKAYVRVNKGHFKDADVEKFKELTGENHTIDFGNPKDVFAIHKIVKSKDWRNKFIKALVNSYNEGDRPPNIVFDITAKEPEKDILEEAIYMINHLGYKVAFVWVVTTRSEALIRNRERDRRVPDETLHKIHNMIAENLPTFLKSKKATDNINDAWICWNSTLDIKQRKMSDEDSMHSMIKLPKTENGFVFDKATENKLTEYLGKMETNPSNPEVYMTTDEIWDKYGIVVDVNVHDSKFDPTKTHREKREKIDRRAIQKHDLYR